MKSQGRACCLAWVQGLGGQGLAVELSSAPTAMVGKAYFYFLSLPMGPYHCVMGLLGLKSRLGKVRGGEARVRCCPC